jgi:adenosylcobinamide-GDP ribazoletransferase
MKSLIAALSFLTRLPVGRLANFGARDVARSAGWFPLIGMLLGAICAATAFLLRQYLMLPIVGILLVGLDVLLTGALHFDGLADTADGFGGGKDREDVLRIMRDHSIGSYGGTALILVIGFKAVAYSILLQCGHWFQAIVLIAALGRWSMLLLTAALPYARQTASVIESMGKNSLLLATLTTACALLASQLWRAWAAASAVLIVTLCFGLYCRRRIAGVTGDTLGANLQLCECAALLAFLWSDRV